MQDTLNPGSENSMNVLLAGCDIPKKQNISMRSDNMQVRAHIQHILTPKDLPRNKNFPLDSSDIDLEYFENHQKRKSPQQSLFFTSNALEDDEIFSCPGKFKFKCVQKKKSINYWFCLTQQRDCQLSMKTKMQLIGEFQYFKIQL